MKLYISQSFPFQFVSEFIPKVLIKYFKEKMSDCKVIIEDYLKSKFNMTLNKFLNLITSSLVATKYGNLYIISINNEYVDSLMRTIDYGNSEFKGLNIFNSSLKKVEKNIKSLYTYYEYLSNR